MICGALSFDLDQNFEVFRCSWVRNERSQTLKPFADITLASNLSLYRKVYLFGSTITVTPSLLVGGA